MIKLDHYSRTKSGVLTSRRNILSSQYNQLSSFRSGKEAQNFFNESLDLTSTQHLVVQSARCLSNVQQWFFNLAWLRKVLEINS